MGFQTLAIEQRASEVVRVLSAVKTEFRKFDEVLTKVKRQLNTASRTIEKTGVRTRAIERSLNAVEQLPEIEASAVLQISDSEAAFEPEEFNGSDITFQQVESSSELRDDEEISSTQIRV